MDLQIPETVVSFEAFLVEHGLTCRRRDNVVKSGNAVIEYGDSKIAVRIVSDRSIWAVRVNDATRPPGKWYDAAIIRDLLFGPGIDVLSLPEQIDIVETHWSLILGSFDSPRRDETHARLLLLGKERLKRRLPGLNLE